MAEKTEKKPESAPAPKESPEKKEAAEKKPAAGGGLMGKTPVLLGIVMVLEAAVLFAGFKFLGGGPQSASAVSLAAEESHGSDSHGDGHGGGHGDKPAAKADKKKLTEINVLEIKAPNTQNGRRYIYDVSIVIAVRGEFEPRIKDNLKERENFVKDRMRTIIAQMDPEKLGGGSEPGLETLRRQVKAQLEIFLGDDMIEEVLVPRCIPFRADF